MIGLKQMEAYKRRYPCSVDKAETSAVFRFGDQNYSSCGILTLHVPTPAGPKRVLAHVVEADIPLLLGLDVLDEYGWNILTVENEVVSVPESWTMPIVRKSGHMFLEWNQYFTQNFSKAQLHHLHLHFMHPSSTKMYNLLRRADPVGTSGETKRILEDIGKSCHACQTYATGPITFQVRFPDKVVFNNEILIDVMYLDNKPVLHIVDAGTNFMSARFLPALDTETVWNTLLYSWILMYTGFPSTIRTDQGSTFTSSEWKQRCKEASVTLKYTGTESHNSLGAGETYHAMLRRVYNKVSLSFPQAPAQLRLCTAVKAINDTAGPDGLVPTLLLFGELPDLPGTGAKHTDTAERFQMMQAAREEYEDLVSRSRVQTALRSKIPSAASSFYRPGDLVYVSRERPHKRWSGPHSVVHSDAKEVLVDVGESLGPRQFNISQIKPARLPPIMDMLSKGSRRPYIHPATPVATNECQQGIRISGSSSIHLTEIIDPGDPRAAAFGEAKKREIEGLLARGTFKLVRRQDAGPRPNVVPSRFVLTSKTQDDGSKLLKARFVLGGHRDRDRRRLVHNSNTLKQSSIRLLLALAAMYGFEVWATDINQAYLQAASNLHRKVFVSPDILPLRPDEILQVVRPLYGLADSGDYWGETLDDHHLRELKMERLSGDLSLFFKHASGKLVGASGTYVDDIIRIGAKEFRISSSMMTGDRFDSKPTKGLPFTFTGLEMGLDHDRITLKQTRYIQSLQEVPSDATFEGFCSIRAKLAWVVHSRPDVAFAVSRLSQHTAETFRKEAIALANRTIAYLRSTSDLHISFPALDSESLFLVCYSDASFSNNADMTSQLGYIVILMDKHQRRTIIQFASRKCRRVTRSCMAAESLALVDAFDNAFVIKHDVQRMIGSRVPLLMLTDSKCLFDVITGSRYTSEKRLMIDLEALREAYKRRDIDNIGLINSADNAADSLTKLKANSALLRLMTQERVDHPLQQYVTEPCSDQ